MLFSGQPEGKADCWCDTQGARRGTCMWMREGVIFNCISHLAIAYIPQNILFRRETFSLHCIVSMGLSAELEMVKKCQSRRGLIKNTSTGKQVMKLISSIQRDFETSHC